jgi:hypothetical protein
VGQRLPKVRLHSPPDWSTSGVGAQPNNGRVTDAIDAAERPGALSACEVPPSIGLLLYRQRGPATEPRARKRLPGEGTWHQTARCRYDGDRRFL